MSNIKDTILEQYEVRKSNKEKTEFIEYIKARLATAGYEYGKDINVEEKGKGLFYSRNIVVGKPETAKILIGAHYDTCAAMPVPNFITPCNFGIYLVWQLLLTLLLCVPVGLLGGVLNVVLDQPDLSFLIAYFLLLVELFHLI